LFSQKGATQRTNAIAQSTNHRYPTPHPAAQHRDDPRERTHATSTRTRTHDRHLCARDDAPRGRFVSSTSSIGIIRRRHSKTALVDRRRRQG
jgi:hypothetical protein